MRRALVLALAASAALAGPIAGTCLAAEPAPPPAAAAIAALATPVRIAATPDDDFADLAPFGAAVGNARIVALDEQTHGGREEFLLKTRLLRYLHERLGFDVLVLESGFFDVGRIQLARQSGAKVDDLAPDNIFYMYSKSAEGRAMLQYLDATQATAHPLVLAGMDSQHTGALSQKDLVPQLAAFLEARGSDLPRQSAWAGFAATVHDMLALRAEQSADDETAFIDTSGAILRELHGARLAHGSVVARDLLDATPSRDEAVSTIGSAGWWARVLIDLQAQNTQLRAPASRARDHAMGDNVVWIADHLAPGRRVVLWGHAIHLMHDAPGPEAPPFAGTLVRRRFGADYHEVHLTGLAGRYLDYKTLKPQDIAAATPGSLEAILATTPGGALYLPPATHVDAEAPPARFMDYENAGALPGRGMNWESTFFIRQLTPVTMVR